MNRRNDVPPPRRGVDMRVLLVTVGVAAVLLLLFLTLDFTGTADDEGSGGPDAEWQAEPQPIPQVPPEEQSSDEPSDS